MSEGRLMLRLSSFLIFCALCWIRPSPMNANEVQVTRQPHGHILTNTAVWSPDSQWIVYDVRSDREGSVFDGTRIECVNLETSQVMVLYESKDGANCGVVTFNPVDDRIVFIHGPEHPTPDWSYSATHRRGVILPSKKPTAGLINLDARDLVAPFTPGALRGGTHVHVFSGDGQWVSFTYEDDVLDRAAGRNGAQLNQRNVGVSVPGHPVDVPDRHPRNHDGAFFSVLVTRTVDAPVPGSDQIRRAFSDAWVGRNGYEREDGARQKRAIAFQGEVALDDGSIISEVFIVDLPEDCTVAGDAPLEGTATLRPAPPKGVVQRRLTRTQARPFPGIQGPRHWMRSSPDGRHIAFLMRDDDGLVQLWTVSPNGGDPVQRTRNQADVASAFSWSPDGRRVAYAMDGGIVTTDISTGRTERLTPRAEPGFEPVPLAVVYAPDGRHIAYLKPVLSGGRVFNQVFICDTAE
jgi:WD40 repeat protein